MADLRQLEIVVGRWFFQGIVHVNIVKKLKKIDFNVVDDIGKWFTQC
jgi:hypothetical protein